MSQTQSPDFGSMLRCQICRQCQPLQNNTAFVKLCWLPQTLVTHCNGILKEIHLLKRSFFIRRLLLTRTSWQDSNSKLKCCALHSVTLRRKRKCQRAIIFVNDSTSVVRNDDVVCHSQKHDKCSTTRLIYVDLWSSFRSMSKIWWEASKC